MSLATESHLVPAAPILRWAGSKRKLLPELVSYWDAGSSRYVEPFAGSAALFFALAPQHAILGDLNADLIATYQAVVEHSRAVHNAITSIEPDRDTYLRLRGMDPKSLSSIQRAARFLYLNRYCFN